MTRFSHKRRICAGLLCLAALALVITPAFGAGKAPKERKISMLYALSASSGMLTAKQGKGSLYKLTLKRLNRNVVWFSDRPARRSGAFPNRVLAESWSGFGFAADPPNAALVYSDKSGRAGRTVIVELSHPRLAKDKLSFSARVLNPDSVKSPNLVDHAARADRDPASKLIDAALFIDDATAPFAGTCEFRPATVCTNTYLPNVPGPFKEWDLVEADFSGTTFHKAVFRNSNFEYANLSDAQLTESILERLDFDFANLTGANLTGTKINWELWEGRPTEFTEFLFANLTNTDLSMSQIREADFTGARMAGVDFENSMLTLTSFDSSQMREANFRAARMGSVSLNSAELAGSSFHNAQLGGVEFRRSNLTDVDFSGSELQDVDFREAKMGGSILTGARLCNVTMPEGTVVNSGC